MHLSVSMKVRSSGQDLKASEKLEWKTEMKLIFTLRATAQLDDLEGLVS